jgi:type IV secretory pathway VirB10-like protein
MKPNVDLESQGELTLIDYVRISGILIFVSLACLCIVLLAHGTERSATIPAQEPITNVTTETAQAEPNIKDKVQGAASVAQQEPHYIAFVSPYAQSSSETPNLPAKPRQSGDAKGKLAAPSLQRAKAIREHDAGHRRPTADLSRRSASSEKSMPRSIKMLVEMWRRAAETNKRGRHERR